MLWGFDAYEALLLTKRPERSGRLTSKVWLMSLINIAHLLHCSKTSHVINWYRKLHEKPAWTSQAICLTYDIGSLVCLSHSLVKDVPTFWWFCYPFQCKIWILQKMHSGSTLGIAILAHVNLMFSNPNHGSLIPVLFPHDQYILIIFYFSNTPFCTFNFQLKFKIYFWHCCDESHFFSLYPMLILFHESHLTFRLWVG